MALPPFERKGREKARQAARYREIGEGLRRTEGMLLLLLLFLGDCGRLGENAEEQKKGAVL